MRAIDASISVNAPYCCDIVAIYSCSCPSKLDSVEMVEDIQSWFKQGEQLANQGFYGEALTQFDRAIELQPDFVPAWVFRAVMLLHLDRDQEALESCDRALELSPTDREAWLFRGVALHRLNRFSEAYASYNNALADQARAQEVPQRTRMPSFRPGNWLTSLWQSLRGWA